MATWFNIPSLGRSYLARRIEYRQGPSPGEFIDIRDFSSDFDLRQQWYDEGASITSEPTQADVSFAAVATHASPFELRKLQLLFGRTGGTTIVEDDAVCTFHFLKLTAGVPQTEWAEGDFTALETAFAAWWTSIKVAFPAITSYKSLRWYKTGPQIDIALGGAGRTGPPVRVLNPTPVVGSGAGNPCPPQVAISVTEKTSDPKAWGRFYLPAPIVTSPFLGSGGRLVSNQATLIADATDTLYQAAITNGTPIVVYSSAKAVRETKAGVELPAKEARALTVDELQVDDLLDVIRSRRWSTPALKVQRAVA